MEEKKDEKKMVNGAVGGPNENGRTPSNNQKPTGGQPKWMQWVFFVTLALFIATLFYPGGDEKRVQKDLSYTKFQAYIEKGDTDEEGNIYVANFEGLLYYDHAEWRIIRTPGTTRVTVVYRALPTRCR